MSEIKRRLMLWASGVERLAPEHKLRSAAEVVMLEDATHLEALVGTGTVKSESIVFVPEGTNVPTIDATVVPYTGDAWGGTNEFGLGDSFIMQSLPYGTMRFVPAFGPTVVRIATNEDFEAFITDADLARSEGRFPAFLKHPMNRLAEQSSLGSAVQGAGPSSRLHVEADGHCSTAPGGAHLGNVNSSLVQLRAEWLEINQRSAAPCAVGLARLVDEELRSAALVDRPWLGDYLDVIEVLQHGEARGIPGLQVSGYGGRLSPVIDEDVNDLQRHGPIVAWNDETCFVHDVGSSRSMLMSHAAGRVVDLLAWSPSLEHAGEYESATTLETVQAQLAQHGLTVDFAGQA